MSKKNNINKKNDKKNNKNGAVNKTAPRKNKKLFRNQRVLCAIKINFINFKGYKKHYRQL